MIGKLHNPNSSRRVLKANPQRVVLWLVLLGSLHPAAAQEAPYSADSLMTAFMNGAQSPLKGSEIRFNDVVTEIKKSRLFFKSSGKGKVICELSSPPDRSNQRPVVGSALTVVGKVRGRGLLGNVTLDQCRLAPVLAVTEQPAPVEPILQAVEEPPQPSSGPVEALPELAVATEPAAIAAAILPKDNSAILPKNNSGLKFAPVATTMVTPAAVDSVPDEPEQPRQTVEKIDALQAVQQCADSPRVTLSYRSHLITLLSGAIAMLIIGRLRRAVANRSHASAYQVSPEEARRAALQELLAREKKKR